MEATKITYIVALSLFAFLLIVSLYNYFFGKPTNQHLLNYNEDVDLYSYKKKLNNEFTSMKDIEKTIVDETEFSDISNITIPTELDEKINVELFTKSALTNDDEWINQRTSFKKDYIIFKMKEIENSNYIGYFHIKDLHTGKMIKEKYLELMRFENDNIDTINRFAVKNGNYEILYIGSFGFIATKVSNIFDIK